MVTLTKNARENYMTAVVLIVLTSVSVLIRFGLKLHRRQMPRGPDWMCLLATAVFLTYSSLLLNFIFNVSPSHSLDLDLRLGFFELTSLAKLVYTCELLFGFGITAVKLSILWFYHTLFAVDGTLRQVIWATTAVSVLWFIVAELVIALQCHPVQAYWEHFDMPPYCLEYPRVLLGYELSNLFVDIAILCIPTGTVLRLQLPWSKKVPIIGIFLLGAVVCIFSIIRITAIWRPPNIFRDLDFGGTWLWSSLQLGVAIVTSCLPTFGPLLQLLARPIPYIKNWYESLRSRRAASKFQSSSSVSSRRGRGRGGDADAHRQNVRRQQRSWLWINTVDEDRDDDVLPSHSWATYGGGGDAGGDGYGYGYGASEGDGPQQQYALRPVPSRAILVNRVVEVV